MAISDQTSTAPSSPRWQRLLPDLLGCLIALLLAWSMGWRTGDLIWSMWLASLVIGYSLIVWNLFSPLFPILRQGGEISAHFREAPGRTSAGLGALLFGKLFLLAFFTVHFGGFHWGHSIFVNSFYPISPLEPGGDFGPTPADYWHVVKTYGWFLPLAFLAQRGLFKSQTQREIEAQLSKTDSTRPEPRKHRSKNADSPDMGAAYKGVVKLHLLIFFLFGADTLGLPEFLAFSVVYLVYFLDWGGIFGNRSHAHQ